MSGRLFYFHSISIVVDYCQMDRATQRKYIQEVVGDNIRDERLALGMTQKQVAELFNSNESYLREIEKGRKEVSLLRIMEIADVLGCSLHDLIDGL